MRFYGIDVSIGNKLKTYCFVFNPLFKLSLLCFCFFNCDYKMIKIKEILNMSVKAGQSAQVLRRVFLCRNVTPLIGTLILFPHIISSLT